MNKRNKQVLLDSPVSNLLPADRVYGRDDPIHRRTIAANIRKHSVLRTDQGEMSLVANAVISGGTCSKEVRNRGLAVGGRILASRRVILIDLFALLNIKLRGKRFQ